MDTTDRPPGYPNDGEELNELNRLLLSTDSFDDFLTELVHYASVQTGHTCSITVRTKGAEPYTAVSTDDLTLRLDEHQYADGNGPCLEALSTRVPVFVVDMATEGSVGSLPLSGGGARGAILDVVPAHHR